MQRTSKTKAALIGASLTILTGIGITAAAPVQRGKLAPAYEALNAFVGDWTGDTTLYISPGLPPTEEAAAESSQKVGQFWVTSRLETKYLGKPYSEILMLGFDGPANQATGSIFSATDPVARPVTGNFDKQSGTWVLFHDTLNSAGMVVPAKTKIHIDQRHGQRTTQRFHLLGEKFESLAMEVRSTRRGR
jgi:hypothetical protein